MSIDAYGYLLEGPLRLDDEAVNLSTWFVFNAASGEIGYRDPNREPNADVDEFTFGYGERSLLVSNASVTRKCRSSQVFSQRAPRH